MVSSFRPRDTGRNLVIFPVNRDEYAVFEEVAQGTPL
jgi:hypothetical protein